MALQHWKLERDADGIAWATLDVAGSSTNTLGSAVMLELASLLDELDRQPPTGLVIRSGKAAGFIAGADIEEFTRIDSPAAARGLVERGWNLFAGDLGSPVAVLRREVMEGNALWMRRFLALSGASLCPHGKTTLAPQLFHRQLAEGAWGLTLATPQQAQVAFRHGIPRVLLANQVVDPAALRALKTRPVNGEGADWAEGIELIYRKLQNIIESEGVVRIQAENQLFDPSQHEAISHEHDPDHESGEIIEVVQQGYRLGDRVLRPARVGVEE